MATHIVLIPVSNHNARKACENIEGRHYDQCDALAHDLKHNEKVEGFEWAEMTDFMDMVNNEEFKQEDWYISYVTIG